MMRRGAVGVRLALGWLCAAGLAVTTIGGVSSAHAAEGEVWLRVNQVGYWPDDPKIAILSSAVPLSGRFEVGEFAADIGADAGAWGPFAHNYRLDFTALRTPGRYVIRFGEQRSPEFTIGTDAYREVAPRLLEFMRLQRCGRNPVTGENCHQQDAIDTETQERRDLGGGWHDAADRIKHMITTTYCVAALYLAGADDEARYGAQLVAKIHPDPNTIYVQIGDDRDHGPPAVLWHEDQTDYGWGAGGPRSAWPAVDRPAGPKYRNASTGAASLAGRTAAALALAGRIEAAKSAYALARARPGCAMSVPVKAPHYYGERSYFDDLEWGAIELYIATREPEYLRQACEYAPRVGASEWLGHVAEVAATGSATSTSATTSVPSTSRPATVAPASQPVSMPARHGHYECFPYVNLAHWRLYEHADAETRGKLVGYYRTALENARRLAVQNPYRLGTPLVWCSTNDVIALATQAVLYERMTGDRQFRPLAAEARDWIFGRNPWGVSFVIGVPAGGDAASRPHHLFWKLRQQLPAGGLVDGPVYKDINDSLKFGDFGVDRLARFQSDAGVYHDAFEDFSTNEPIIDGTVSLLLLLHVWTEGGK
jgi:endoglucanase